MNELQSKILEIFKEFDRICRDNDLKYFAIGGTCIGAIRHKGFIPWDDDLDVAMPLEDYNRFREVAPSSLAPQYQIHDYEEHEKCGYQFLKLFDRNTTYIEERNNNPDSCMGVFIDIMPIACWDDNVVSKLKILIINYYKQLNVCRRFFRCDEVSPKIKLLQVIMRPFYRNKPFNYFSLKIEQIVKKNNQFYSKSPGCIFFTWRRPKRSLFSYEIFKECLLVAFEDTEIPVPIGYDRYLRKDFGDYMVLPPENKRISIHPPVVIDLENSYLNYIERSFP